MCVMCMGLCVCVIFSVFGPLKGSCRAEGEEKITGADIICFCHVDLASDLTQCGPVRHGRQVDVPAHMLRQDACMHPAHSLTCTCIRVGTKCVHTGPDKRPLTHSAKKKSHTHTFLHPQRCTLGTHTVSFFVKEVSY